jgi:protein TonB
MMGRGSPLAFWVGVSLALHLLAGVAWLAAPPAPAASAQARLLAVHILNGVEQHRSRVEQVASQPRRAEARPTTEPSATSVGRASARQPAITEPPPATEPSATSVGRASARQPAITEPPHRAPLTESKSTLALRLQTRLLELLAEHLHYPPLAQRRGWEGVVLMQLRMEANGDISRLQVLESSGYPLLDRAATRGLQQVERLPQAVAWLRGEPFELVLPVHYRLIDL